MDIENDNRFGWTVVVAGIAVVGLVAVLLSPGAAIVLATGLTVIATFLSTPKTPRTPSAHGAVSDDMEIVQHLEQLSMPVPGTVLTEFQEETFTPVSPVAASSLSVASHGSRQTAILSVQGPAVLDSDSTIAEDMGVASGFDDELIAAIQGISIPAAGIDNVESPPSQSPWVSAIGEHAQIRSFVQRLSRVGYLSFLIWGSISGVLAYMLFTGLSSNPVGFFGDEAEIGFRTHEFITKRLTHLDFPIFYNHFGYTHLGALPLYASAPFVAVLGLSEFSVRLSSVFWGVAGLIMLIALVRRLQWAFGEVGVLVFAFSPIFIHISRVNFAHGPSFFCVAAGLYCFVRAKQEQALKWTVLAGVGLGLSIYGNAAYYLATPVVILGLAVGEFVVNRWKWRRYAVFAGTLGVSVLLAVPVLIKAFTDDEFMRRFHDKQYSNAPLLSRDRLSTVAENYGKYFSTDFLFTKGESGMPGGFISRHSVLGAGEFAWITLPLVVIGIIAIFRTKEPIGRAMGVAGLVILVLYPLPDVLSTSTLNPPYTLAVFPTLIFVPLLSAFGINWIVQEIRAIGAPYRLDRVVPLALLAIIVFGGVQFYRGPYERYPLVSAEYYGWQYGPEQAIGRFEDYGQIYDHYFLDGDFNEAYIFLDFYLIDNPELRRKSQIGGFEMFNAGNHDLYAVRRERYTKLLESDDFLRNFAKVVDVIYYPDGQIAMYLVDMGMGNYDGTREQPR